MASGPHCKILFLAVVAAVIYHISAAPARAKRDLPTVRLLSEEAGKYIAVASDYSVYGESDPNSKYKYIQQQPYIS